MSPQLSYTSNEVARIACVTLRQLQWWDEHNVLSPAQHAHKRVYQPRELYTAMLFRDLRERGFSLQQIRKIWKKVEGKGFDFTAPQTCWLLTDGARVELLEQAAPVVAFLQELRPRRFVVLSLSGLAERVAARLAQAPASLLRRGPGIAHVSSARVQVEEIRRQA